MAGLYFSLGTPVFSTNKTDRHDIIEILLKVALNTIQVIESKFINALYLKFRNDINVVFQVSPFQL